MIQEAFTIARKDLKAELRSKRTIISMLLFVLLLVVTFHFVADQALEEGSDSRPNLIGGLLWTAFIFSGILGLTRSFSIEADQGSLEGLLLSPSGRSSIYLGKVLSNMVFLLFIEALTVVFFILFLNADFGWKWLELAPIIVLGTFGFVAVGCLLSAIAIHAKAQGTFLPILLFPLLIPLIITAVVATGEILSGGDPGASFTAIRLLAVYDIIFFSTSVLTFEYVIEG